MRQVVIANYGRTAFSRARPKDPAQDPWGDKTAEELLALVVPEILQRSSIKKDEVGNFLVGCALGVGEQWTFGGRTSSLLAGLGPSVPARFIDMQCGSGMAAIESAFFEIASGQTDIVFAAGMENMTRVPVGPSLFKKGYMSVNPRVYQTTDDWDMVTGLNMGLTAELLAEQGGFKREQLDAFAIRSHQLAATARRQGYFAAEIIGENPSAGGANQLTSDQNIREDTCPAELAELKTAFRDDGVITAGNSSPLSSGAAAMLLMSQESARSKGLEPTAKIVATGLAGVRPESMGTGPVPAIKKALANAGLSLGDIDLWEINEAFSVVVLNAAKELGLSLEQINVHGGALALGHPLGATGIRLVGTLARGLQEQGKKYGCAAACIGGGQGIAIIVEAC